MQARNRALLAWYRSGSRDVPWRSTQDPWHVLVGETMAQQTQLSRVADRFPTFMKQYPTPADFGSVTDRIALREWSGLGYNSRALRLRDAAALVAGSGWPTDVDGLTALPGVGAYTAAAVASIAFGTHVIAVDTNIRRVVSRWQGRPLSDSEIRRCTDELMTDARARHWNQAVMDLGALVCRREPNCADCPVGEWCADPSVRMSTRQQPKWEGSVRQARGAVVRALIETPATAASLVARTGLGRPQVDAALASLKRDAMVSESAGAFTIAD